MAGTDSKVALVASVPMFARCGRKELQQLTQLVDEIEVPAGRVLMRQGEHGEEMFIVVKGRFSIERDGRTIAERGPGSALGEMSLLSGGPRTATITALEPSTVLVAAHREFNSLMDSYPAIRLQVLEGLAQKVRALDHDGVH